jgi:hypothetical protein
MQNKITTCRQVTAKSFENVAKFKIAFTNKLRACHNSVQNILSSHVLSKNRL